VVSMYQFRKQVEQSILSTHGDATRYFVTFVDNHDMKERIRYEQPGNPAQYDAQVSMAVGCLYALPGIPCIYYGTEQGLHGAGSDPAVREALWGMAPAFPMNSNFYLELQKLAGVRATAPALRYGRYYFRPISGDGINFGVSPFPGGIIAWSRILNDTEVVVVANTSAAQAVSIDVILDISLSAPGDQLRLRYSNHPAPAAPAAVRTLQQVTVAEVDGSTSHGPLNVMRATLQPMELQILQR
jgi:glycosidase